MESYKTKIGTCAMLLAAILAASCSESSNTNTLDGSSNTNTNVTSLKPTVTLASEQVNASVGETFTLDIAMRNFPISEGGGVNVQFDANMLNVSDVTINTGSWNFVNKVGDIDNNSGLISDILFSSYNGVVGDSQIATITFNAIGSGNSQIILKSSSVNPFSSNGNVIDTDFIYSNVHIAAAP